MVYSFALGIATVVLPLLALHQGYSKPTIGILTAVSAVSQLTTRLMLGRVMRRHPDWLLVFTAGLFLAASCALVATAPSPAPFLLAELLQGVARACFWTGSHTHVVRGKGSSVRRLAEVNFVSSLGLLAGPIAGGLIATRSFALALWVAAAVALVGLVPPTLLDRLPPFPSRPPGTRKIPIWRRPGVDVGCLAGVSAGAWRGLLNSYVPVLLVGSGQSNGTIGGLVSAANFASLIGAIAVARVSRRQLPAVFGLSTAAAGVGLAFAAWSGRHIVLEGLALALSGLGAGSLQTIGPAVATDSVESSRRGDAIALAGTYRAAALFVAPLAAGAAVTLAPLTVVIAAAGGLVAVPALLRRRAAAVTPDLGSPDAPGAGPGDVLELPSA